MFKVYLSPTQVILVTLPACPTPFQYYILSTTIDSKSLIRYILNVLKKIKKRTGIKQGFTLTRSISSFPPPTPPKKKERKKLHQTALCDPSLVYQCPHNSFVTIVVNGSHLFRLRSRPLLLQTISSYDNLLAQY